MKQAVIDSHIHVDLYKENERTLILEQLTEDHVDALISVSMDLSSCRRNLQLAMENKQIKPAFGFHPEQPLPTEQELSQLIDFLNENEEKMIAVGEVGLPYYLRQEKQHIQLDRYIELLEVFIQQAVLREKPIVLHAVYEDAPIVCELLEKHSVKKAHFHWFKGDQKTMERMIRNDYFISVTPDILYEYEIQQLVKVYPLSKIMVETDGPWPFEGIFKDQLTHPKMMHETIRQIAQLKKQSVQTVYEMIYQNSLEFYELKCSKSK